MLGKSIKNIIMKSYAADYVKTNIMVADKNLKIIYMNNSIKELLGEAESDLKKELPRFDMRHLIGSNIDVFHKNPTHQRSMLSALKSQYMAAIKIGPRAFDLIVTPLDRGGQRIGYVVEWSDARIRLANLDFQKQIEAVSRVQAVISFLPDGTILDANNNFLDLMGYQLREIVGRKQGIFLESGTAASRDYKEFWDNLRSGHAQVGEFTRFGKNGKKCVISASYNPIADEKGSVYKVVKYATDVTDRVDAVEYIGDALRRVSSGDLTVVIERNFARDFDQLRTDLNNTVANLSSTLSSVISSTDQIERGSRELSQGAYELSKRTEQQAASLEETAAALDEVTTNVKNAAQRAQEARDATRAANTCAVHSGEIVADAVGAMARIEQSSNQISSIIGVIDEIAFQTNLLALNAGVEAARAGDAGKGFAVVAQEVRELAQRSAHAAKEIKDLIRNSSEEVTKGVKLVSETGRALDEIQSNIAIVNEHMQSISASSTEQSIVLSEVNVAVNSMDQMTQQNAAMVEQSTAASSNLTDEAAMLRDLVSVFKLNKSDRPNQIVEARAEATKLGKLKVGGVGAGSGWSEF